ncbi:MAG TPA: hypothetical protein VG145_03800 [Xanthobacteraceae bacterium]|nr:hypothetical protein [Xanthobacteraceae bacterium]
MKKQLAICAGLWLLGFGAAGTAAAQTIYGSPELSDPVLPAYEIMSIVRSTGLRPLTRPMRRGPYYVLVAVDRVGRQMRVVVDAQLGDIVNLRPAVAVGSYGPEAGRPVVMPSVATPPADVGGATPGYGSRPGGDNAQAPTPPRSIPNARTVNAAPTAAPPPSRVAVAEPALPPPPPLPRPRPKLALNDAPAQSPVPAPAQSAAPAPAETQAGRPAGTPPAVAPPAPSGAGENGKPIE